MNITPALPNPYQPADHQDRAPVGAVRAPNRTRDAADDAERRQSQVPARTGRLIDQGERERLAAQAGATLHRQGEGNRYGERAVAAYAGVADQAERGKLRDLLGFDAYA